MKTLRCVAIAFAFTIVLRLLLSADVKLPAMFSDHAVLQRDMPVPVWGWAEPGEEVTVSIAGQTQKATADDKGKWSVKLDPLSVGEPLDARGRRQEPFGAQGHPCRRGVGLLRPVEHGMDRGQRDEPRSGSFRRPIIRTFA